MRIAIVAHIRFPIAVPFMGGMEAHCASLCNGLVSSGHDVMLFAAPGSDTRAQLIPICDAAYEDVLPWEQWRGTETLNAYQARAFDKAWSIIGSGEFDVVHNNCLYPELLIWAERDGVPMLTSQHVPPFGRMREAVREAAGKPLLQFSVTSNSQERLWFDTTPSNMRTVHNGIDTEAWLPGLRTDALLWSGRITPNKGTALALQAAHRAGVAMNLVGSVEDATYFTEAVEPLLDERRRYLGHRSGAELYGLMASARALVVTPMWDEPFGLVAAEALSCDIPVIAFDRGALSEVVGDCGALVPAGDVSALADAMRNPPELRPGAARMRAREMFSIASMIAGYEKLYHAAMNAAASLAVSE